MAMVNPILNLANAAANVKDSRWLTLEVCREYQRNKCTRSDTECKFAHPPAHVEVQNGRVTACFDSIKGKCQRKDPPCKYLHPPQHLREQLLQNGRNNLILKNLAAQAALNPPIVPGMIPTIANASNKGPVAALPALYPSGQVPILIPDQMYGWSGGHFGNTPYLAGSVPQSSMPYSPYGVQTVAVPSSGVDGTTIVSQPMPGVIPTALTTVAATQPKLQRADRLEQSAIPPMIPYKRLAVPDSKSGLPVYQPGAATNISSYQHALAAMHLQQLGQQQYVPVAYKNGPQTAVYPSTAQSPGMPIQQSVVPVTIAGHPPGVPRF